MAELLCEVGLPRSSYIYHRARLQVADKYVEARQLMTDIFERNYRCYGYRRMRASLTDQSVNISEKVVRRLMKQECLVAATSKRRRYGSYLGEISPAPENVLNRDFSASAPNEKWLTDITEFVRGAVGKEKRRLKSLSSADREGPAGAHQVWPVGSAVLTRLIGTTLGGEFGCDN